MHWRTSFGIRRYGERPRGDKMPSADTIGRGFCCMSLKPLRQMIVAINRNAWRTKAIHQPHGQTHRVVAVDGHETVASRSRCCDKCLVRELRIKGKDGTVRKVKEYYHRIVVAQWVGCTPPPVLYIELFVQAKARWLRQSDWWRAS